MVDQLPRQIQQVQDFSNDAARLVMHALDKQPNNFKGLEALANKYFDAVESERVANAIDLFTRRRESGQSAVDALNGIDARIAGSKVFRDRMDGVRDSIIKQTTENRAQAEFANKLQKQLQEEDAKKLAYQYHNFIKTAGSGAAGYFLERPEIKKQLDSNPYVYSYLPAIDKEFNTDLKPYTSPDKIGLTLDANSLTKLNDTVRELKTRDDYYRSLGINTNLSDEEALKLRDLSAWIKEEGKLRGYSEEGNGGKFSDFSENMGKAYNQLRAYGASKGLTLPDEVILRAMKTNMDNGGILPWNQEDIDISGAKAWLDKYGSTWQTNLNHARALAPILKTLEDAQSSRILQNAIAGLSTEQKRLSDLVASNRLSETEAKNQLAKYVAGLNTNLSPVLEALNSSIFYK